MLHTKLKASKAILVQLLQGRDGYYGHQSHVFNILTSSVKKCTLRLPGNDIFRIKTGYTALVPFICTTHSFTNRFGVLDRDGRFLVM